MWWKYFRGSDTWEFTNGRSGGTGHLLIRLHPGRGGATPADIYVMPGSAPVRVLIPGEGHAARLESVHLFNEMLLAL